MPSYKPRITVYTDEITNLKLAYIAKSENRSSSNYTEYLIKKKIIEYEAQYGEIEINTVTRKEALEAQKTTIKNSTKQPLKATLKESFENGLNLGKANK